MIRRMISGGGVGGVGATLIDMCPVVSRFNVSSQNKSEISVLCLPCPKNEMPTTRPQFPTNGTKLDGWGAGAEIVTLISFLSRFTKITVLIMYFCYVMHVNI